MIVDAVATKTKKLVDPDYLIVCRVAMCLALDGNVVSMAHSIRRKITEPYIEHAIDLVANRGGWTVHEVEEAICRVARY